MTLPPSLLIFLPQLEAGMVSYDSFRFSQVFFSLSVKTSFGQHSDGVNPGFNSQLNEQQSIETLSCFQAWFILHCHSEATIQSGFLFPAESSLSSSSSRDSLEWCWQKRQKPCQQQFIFFLRINREKLERHWTEQRGCGKTYQS